MRSPLVFVIVDVAVVVVQVLVKVLSANCCLPDGVVVRMAVVAPLPVGVAASPVVDGGQS